MPIETSNTIRVLATFFIVMHHVLWPAYNSFSLNNANPLVWLVAFVNQAGKPAVMFYIILSGIAFGNKGGSSLSLFLERAKRVLIPYLFFSLLYAILNNRLTSLHTDLFNGGASYHLYFVPLIFSCYLILPLFQKYSDRASFSAFIVLSFLLGTLFLQQNTGANSILINFQISLENWRIENLDNYVSVRWLLYFTYTFPLFYLGVKISKLKRNQLTTKPLYIPIVVLITYAIVFFDFSYRVEHLGDSPDRAGRIWRYSVLFYIAALIWLFRHWKPSFSRLSRLSLYSYPVYLIHPLFIDHSHSILLPTNLLITLCSSWGILILLHRYLPSGSFARTLIGLPESRIDRKI